MAAGGRKVSNLRQLTAAIGKSVSTTDSPQSDIISRIGQTKPVNVYQLIAENTVESKVRFGLSLSWMYAHERGQVVEIQEKKKKLISEVCWSIILSCHDNA